jgi:hypothetical protein
VTDQRQTELACLEGEERALSARRARLHDRIDFLRSHGDLHRLEQSETEEQVVSAERRALHQRIDALRVELGLQPGPPPKQRLLD